MTTNFEKPRIFFWGIGGCVVILLFVTCLTFFGILFLIGISSTRSNKAVRTPAENTIVATMDFAAKNHPTNIIKQTQKSSSTETPTQTEVPVTLFSQTALSIPTETKSITTIPTSIQVENSTNTPETAVQNMQIEIINITTYKDKDGGLDVLGEVINKNTSPVKSTKVTISLYDANNNLVDTKSSYAYIPWELNFWNIGILYPTEQAPFVLIFDTPGDWVTYKSEVEFEIASDEDYSNHYRDLRAINDIGRAIEDLLYNYQVTGEIENIGNSICGNVWIVVTLYNDNNQVVGVDYITTDKDSLSPGQTTPFKVQMYSRNPVAYYRLLIEAIKH
jgi:hypothetical protein